MSGTTSTTASNTVSAVTSDTSTQTRYAQTTLRPRTVVIYGKKMKPSTALNIFLSDVNVNAYYTPCTKIEIVSPSAGFITADQGAQTDYINFRTTAVNSYDIINVGEVVSSGVIAYGPPAWLPAAGPHGGYDGFQTGQLVGTTTTITGGGVAVVIANETIYDPSTGTNKNILYVTNVQGTFSTSAIIKGLTSLSTATIISVTAATLATNSIGNIYGVLNIVAETFAGGSNSIMLSDAASSSVVDATTYADAGYISYGTVNTFTEHVTNTATTTNTTTVVNNYIT